MPRSEKRTIASGVDLYVIECRSKFELISLPALMIEHISKVIHEKEGRHGMPYGYFLNRVFDHFGVVCEKGTPGTVIKMFSLTTLIENECVEGKVGTISQVSELLVIQENLSKEMEEIRVSVAAKDAEILKMKMKNQKLSSEGPGVAEALRTKNVELKKKVSALTTH